LNTLFSNTLSLCSSLSMIDKYIANSNRYYKLLQWCKQCTYSRRQKCEWGKFHTEDANIRRHRTKFVATETWCPGFMQTYINPLTFCVYFLSIYPSHMPKQRYWRFMYKYLLKFDSSVSCVVLCRFP
jgi:hypothetical protein